MRIEKDHAHIISGVRQGKTLARPSQFLGEQGLEELGRGPPVAAGDRQSIRKCFAAARARRLGRRAQVQPA